MNLQYKSQGIINFPSIGPLLKRMASSSDEDLICCFICIIPHIQVSSPNTQHYHSELKSCKQAPTIIQWLPKVSLQNIIRVKSAILGQENPKWWGVQPHQGMTNGKGTDAGRIQPRPQGCIIFLVEVRCWLRTSLSSNHFIF